MKDLQDDSLMPFGKYRGIAMVNVPEQYLIYIYDNNMIYPQYANVKAYIEANIGVIKTQIQQKNKYKQ